MKVPFYLWATRAGVAKSMGIAMIAGMLLGHSVPGLAQQDQDAPKTEASVEEIEKSREQLEDELSVTRSELENHKEEMQKMRERIEYLEGELAETLEEKAAAATANDSQEETEEEGSVNLESAKDTAGETAQALADAYRRDNPEEIEQYSEQLYHDQRLVSLMQDDTTLYRVKQGESLANIAMRYYGDANRWPEIHEANSHVIENPDRLWPRMTLLLPM
ncbi:LysM peptidoglycan-binding domain-containing protein [Halomonas sediminis]